MKSLFIMILSLLLTLPFAFTEQDMSPEEIIDTWHNKAIELKNEGKYSEAELLFKKIITVEPTNPNAHFDLGNVYFYEKRYNEALDYYKKAFNLGLDSQHLANYYYMLSLCYIGLCNNKEAIDCLKKCLEANPNYENAKELLEMVEEAYNNGEKLNIEEEPIKSKVKNYLLSYITKFRPSSLFIWGRRARTTPAP